MRGGKRPGAGRPRGVKSNKTLAIADRAIAEGITPLEVILEAMRGHHSAGRLDQAAAIAKDAAPYMHPRLAAIEHAGKPGSPIETREVGTLEAARRIAFLLASATEKEPG